jgi:hypothetical protein
MATDKLEGDMAADNVSDHAGLAGPGARRATVDLAPAEPATAGDLTEALVTADWWTDSMVQVAGIPVVGCPLVTIGGGIGSFVTVDYLRIAGMSPDRIRVLSNIGVPWQTYEYLTRVSQIPRGERIRSESASRPDNRTGRRFRPAHPGS